MATAGGGKGGGTTSGWNNRKRKYLNIRHALKTHCIGQWYQDILTTELVSKYINVLLVESPVAEVAAGVERSRVTKVGQRNNGGAIGSGHWKMHSGEKCDNVSLKMHSGEKSAQGTGDNNGKWSEHHCELSICLSKPECGSL